ncbi:hypothetical protein B0H15DRAFT_978103 [Mycena belliarum]|uniref:Uncharacterized protein n=1 Tax=Mycena belliarum TaxID=1033014 RepID=A0AAD6TMQ5_9AGAR|nr:hypothetical protein B0H15DRAFT_978103 [Mycena belliae]
MPKGEQRDDPHDVVTASTLLPSLSSLPVSLLPLCPRVSRLAPALHPPRHRRLAAPFASACTLHRLHTARRTPHAAMSSVRRCELVSRGLAQSQLARCKSHGCQHSLGSASAPASPSRSSLSQAPSPPHATRASRVPPPFPSPHRPLDLVRKLAAAATFTASCLTPWQGAPVCVERIAAAAALIARMRLTRLQRHTLRARHKPCRALSCNSSATHSPPPLACPLLFHPAARPSPAALLSAATSCPRSRPLPRPWTTARDLAAFPPASSSRRSARPRPSRMHASRVNASRRCESESDPTTAAHIRTRGALRPRQTRLCTAPCPRDAETDSGSSCVGLHARGLDRALRCTAPVGLRSGRPRGLNLRGRANGAARRPHRMRALRSPACRSAPRPPRRFAGQGRTEQTRATRRCLSVPAPPVALVDAPRARKRRRRCALVSAGTRHVTPRLPPSPVPPSPIPRSTFRADSAPARPTRGHPAIGRARRLPPLRRPRRPGPSQPSPHLVHAALSRPSHPAPPALSRARHPAQGLSLSASVGSTPSRSQAAPPPRSRFQIHAGPRSLRFAGAGQTSATARRNSPPRCDSQPPRRGGFSAARGNRRNSALH